MSWIRRIALCGLAVLALGGFAASAASAASPAWWVNGKPLAPKATEPIAETTEVSTAFVIKAGAIAIECTGIRLEKSNIEGEKAANLGAIRFEGCKESGAPGCTVSSFSTNALKATLGGAAKAFKLTFESAKGGPVATIKPTGEKCSTIELTGIMACNYPNVEAAAVVHELEFTNTSGSKLKALGVEAKLTGIDKFRLASGLTWFVE
jgi:hypothetical protein